MRPRQAMGAHAPYYHRDMTQHRLPESFHAIRPPATGSKRGFRYLDVITASFVAILLISNVTALKLVKVDLDLFGHPFTLITDGALLIFPVSYIFGDILTEVYGFRRSRKVIWMGFAWLILFNFLLGVATVMPPEPGWEKEVGQKAFLKVFQLSPKVAMAGILAYFWGEFANSIVLAKMKVLTRGRYLWMRTIGSTVVGQFIDTLLFCVVAYWGTILPDNVLPYALTGYVLKVGIEVFMTPVTYAVVGYLKRAEREDFYDYDTRFNPFTLRD